MYNYLTNYSMKKSFRIFIIITLIGFLFYSYLFYSETGRFPEYFKQPLLLTLIIIISNLIGWSIIISNKLLNKLILWKKNIALRFITGIISNSILCIILAFLAFILYITISTEDITIYSALNKFSEVLIKLGILSFITIFIYSIIDFSNFLFPSRCFGRQSQRFSVRCCNNTCHIFNRNVSHSAGAYCTFKSIV